MDSKVAANPKALKPSATAITGPIQQSEAAIATTTDAMVNDFIFMMSSSFPAASVSYRVVPIRGSSLPCPYDASAYSHIPEHSPEVRAEIVHADLNSKSGCGI